MNKGQGKHLCYVVIKDWALDGKGLLGRWNSYKNMKL